MKKFLVPFFLAAFAGFCRAEQNIVRPMITLADEGTFVARVSSLSCEGVGIDCTASGTLGKITVTATGGGGGGGALVIQQGAGALISISSFAVISPLRFDFFNSSGQLTLPTTAIVTLGSATVTGTYTSSSAVKAPIFAFFPSTFTQIRGSSLTILGTITSTSGVITSTGYFSAIAIGTGATNEYLEIVGSNKKVKLVAGYPVDNGSAAPPIIEFWTTYDADASPTISTVASKMTLYTTQYPSAFSTNTVLYLLNKDDNSLFSFSDTGEGSIGNGLLPANFRFIGPGALVNIEGLATVSSFTVTNGSVTINGPSYLFPAAHGTNGQVWKENGLGVLTWSDDIDGDVSGSTTARLNNLDFSTSVIRSNLNNVVSTNIVNGTLASADFAPNISISSLSAANFTSSGVVIAMSTVTANGPAIFSSNFFVYGTSNSYLSSTYTAAGLKWTGPPTTCSNGQLWKFDDNGAARCAGDDNSGGAGDVSGTTTTRLNNLDSSTSALTIRIGNLDSSTATLRTGLNIVATSTGVLTIQINNLDTSTSALVALIQDATDQLSLVGDINFATNPVDWSMLKNVPAGFADGADAGTADVSGTTTTRLNNLDTSTATLTTRISNLDSSTATLTTRLANLDSSTAAISARDVSGTTTTRLNNLDTSTAALTTRIGNLDSSTATLTTRVSNLTFSTSMIGSAFYGNILSTHVTPSVFLSSNAIGVTEGSYTNTNLTVDRNGRIVAASNGTGGSAATASLNLSTQGSGAYTTISSMTLRLPNYVGVATINTSSATIDLSSVAIKNATATWTAGQTFQSGITVSTSIVITGEAHFVSTEVWHFIGPNCASGPAVYITASTDPAFGQVSYSFNTSSTTNLAKYFIPVSTGMMMSADPSIDGFMVLSSATDSGTMSFVISIATISSGQSPWTSTAAMTNPIVLNSTFTSSNGAYTLRMANRAVLTGWKTVLQSAGGLVVIQVGRDNPASATSKLRSASMPFNILIPKLNARQFQ